MSLPLPPAEVVLPRAVIIDCYDSYTANLLTLLGRCPDKTLLERVIIIKQDQFSWPEFRERILPHIDCVILSPGPGRPEREQDFGFCAELIREVDLPILGVCLGHQGIATSFGGAIKHVSEIQHGQRSKIAHSGKGLFAGVPQNVEMVTYNSLTVDRARIPDDLEVTAWLPNDESVVMGVSHRTRNVHGVQFHPESIHSSYGAQLIENFLAGVPHGTDPSATAPLPSWLLQASSIRSALPSIMRSRSDSAESAPLRQRWALQAERFEAHGRDLDVRRVFEVVFGNGSNGQIWLDSAKPGAPSSSYSYISAPAHLITHDVGSDSIRLHHGPALSKRATCSMSRTSEGGVTEASESFFRHFSRLQKSVAAQTDFAQAKATAQSIEWKAGWVGWFGYEMKAESLAGYTGSVGTPKAVSGSPDSCFAFADRVLAFEHETRSWIALALVQVGTDGAAPSSTPSSPTSGSTLEDLLASEDVQLGLSPEDWSTWLNEIRGGFDLLSAPSSPIPTFPPLRPFVPDHPQATYSAMIDAARAAIFEGETYELTLTTQFRSAFEPSTDFPSPASLTNIFTDPLYALYLRLRTTNPAPYSSFLRFPQLDLAIISSSPERFIKITAEGQVEMKPIKGTIGRCHADPEEDLRRKLTLQNDRKEIAENLMIVDLIRADLLTCCDPSTVQVPKLIQVETYDHVHTLVTTVVGKLGADIGPIEAVERCFPPGSMTGAPKLRSVQILEELEEHRPRGIYSGGLGYVSLDGAVDLSVVIRTIVAHGDRLSIGAGGAITWLSSREGEWDEVLVKVGSVTRGLFDRL